MRGIRFLVPVLLCLFLFTEGFAQTGKKPIGDIIKIKTPANIISVTSAEEDPAVVEEPGEGEDPTFQSQDPEENEEGEFFDGAREITMGMEDTSSSDGEISIVEVDEELKMDCVWVKIATHYAQWSSRSVNPYGIDGTHIKNVSITMYDSTKGRNWIMPLRKIYKTSGFAFRNIRWHYGVDLDLETGDSIYTAFDGVVRMVSWDGRGWGNYVLVRHYNGLETLYGHMSKTATKVGDLVKAGDLIGFGGNTGGSRGSHLHLEIRYAGNPIDPEYFFDFYRKKLRFQQTVLTPANFSYLKTARQTYHHTLKSGQTLSHISRKYNVPVAKLCKLNNITTKTPLRVGRRIRIR